MTPLWLELTALYVYGPLIVLFHELGHAVFARRGGFRVTSFAVGLGRPLVRLGTIRGAVVWVGRWIFGGGFCVASPISPATRQRAWFYGGGLLVQLGLALVLWAGSDIWWVARAATFNVLVFLTNAIPWRWGTSASDGWMLLDLMRGARRQSEILPQRAALKKVAIRESVVESPLGEAWAGLCLAWGDVVAGDTDAAGSFLETPPAALRLEPYVHALSTYVTAEWHRRAHRPEDALATTTGFASPNASDATQGFVALAHAGALLDVGDRAEACRVLGSLLSGPDFLVRQALVLLLRATLEGPTEDIEHAAWRVLRHIDAAWLDPVRTATTLQEAANRLSCANRATAATGIQQAVQTLVARTLSTAHSDHKSVLQDYFAGLSASEASQPNAL
jgi:hypothetical protein